jgi:hypothetical protein
MRNLHACMVYTADGMDLQGITHTVNCQHGMPIGSHLWSKPPVVQKGRPDDGVVQGSSGPKNITKRTMLCPSRIP